MNRNASLTALMLTAALAAGPAAAIDQDPPGDPALDLRLSQAGTGLPVFLLEAETAMGFELEGDVIWTVNGRQVDVQPIETAGGAYLDVQALPLQEAAQVCAIVSGRLSLGGDLGRDVDEHDCLIWESTWEPVQPVAGVRSLLQVDKRHELRLPRPARR